MEFWMSKSSIPGSIRRCSERDISCPSKLSRKLGCALVLAWNDRSSVFVIDTRLLLAALGLAATDALDFAMRRRLTFPSSEISISMTLVSIFFILRNLLHLAFDCPNLLALLHVCLTCRDASLTCREDPGAAAQSPHLTLCLHYQ